MIRTTYTPKKLVELFKALKEASQEYHPALFKIRRANFLRLVNKMPPSGDRRQEAALYQSEALARSDAD